jgi:hypothetical protein
MARVIGDTSKFGILRRRGKFIRVLRDDHKKGVLLRLFTGVRHADQEVSTFNIPREQLTDVINLLLEAERKFKES